MLKVMLLKLYMRYLCLAACLFMIGLAKAHDLNEDSLEQSLYVNVREIKQEMEAMKAANDSGPTDNADVATVAELVG